MSDTHFNKHFFLPVVTFTINACRDEKMGLGHTQRAETTSMFYLVQQCDNNIQANYTIFKNS